MKLMFSRVIKGVGIEPIVVMDEFPEGTNKIRMYNNLIAAFHDDEILQTFHGPNKDQYEVLDIRE